MEYRGGFHLVIETKVNLMKLKSDPRELEKEVILDCLSFSVF